MRLSNEPTVENNPSMESLLVSSTRVPHPDPQSSQTGNIVLLLFPTHSSFLASIPLYCSYLFVLGLSLAVLGGGGPVILISVFPVPSITLVLIPLQMFFFSCINSDQLAVLLRKSLSSLGTGW